MLAPKLILPKEEKNTPLHDSSVGLFVSIPTSVDFLYLLQKNIQAGVIFLDDVPEERAGGERDYSSAHAWEEYAEFGAYAKQSHLEEKYTSSVWSSTNPSSMNLSSSTTLASTILFEIPVASTP